MEFAQVEGIAIIILFGLVVWLVMELKTIRKEIRQKQPASNNNSLLQLQAYERLALLVERINLRNLITKIPSAGLSAAELQAGMIEIIKSEFDHNITQQIYITSEVWKAIKNLKEQNIYIINQLVLSLPNTATSLDLNKLIIKYLETNNVELSDIVLEAIQFEVKKLM